MFQNKPTCCPRSISSFGKNLQKKKKNEEFKASGISPEESEVKQGILDIMERFDESSQEHAKLSEKKKIDAQIEMSKAEEIRKMSLETFSETKKRKMVLDGDEKPPKQRKSSTDPFAFLYMKADQDNETRVEEMNIRKAELDLKKQSMQDQREEERNRVIQNQEQIQLQ